MTQPRPTVGGVIRSVLDEFLGANGPRLMPEQRRTLKDLAACRTAALGGHVLGCLECGHLQIAYNSCGNRHCPTCQATRGLRGVKPGFWFPPRQLTPPQGTLSSCHDDFGSNSRVPSSM